MKYLGLFAVAAVLSACGTMEGGTSQDITLRSNADNASCSIAQNGAEIVPATALGESKTITHSIPRTSGNLFVTCSAPGHNSETVALMAGKHPRTVAGVLLTGALINAGTDIALGGWDEYQNEAYIHLTRTASGS
ncbi:MAG: hypothetical protein AAGD13_18205 [Pseudomonadota bacterium]